MDWRMSTAIRNIITRDTSKEEVKKVYSTYQDTQPKGFEQFHASTVDPIFAEIPVGAKVLDVGANSGEMMRLLQTAKQCRVKGVDLSLLAIEEAKKKGTKVLYADAENLPFKDASFDVVILREVLTHIHEPLKALKEIRRVLKPKGFLIGSAPHANLERIAWDEKRLHHRYYDENTIQEHLKDSFEEIHLRILNGAQFTIGFANSMLADQPAEILFKCGSKGTLKWDQALLQDKRTLRAWMGPTQPPADAYYRMIGYAIKMRQMKGVEIGFDAFKWTDSGGTSAWQEKLRMNEAGNPSSAIAMNQFENCLKVADPWVFQLTGFDDILAFFEVAKQVHPTKKFVTEMDDWIFDLPGYNVASNPYKPNSTLEKIAYDQIKLSDAIIVSTSFLKESVLKIFPEKKVHIIPNTIDFDLWDHCLSDEKMEKKKDGMVRIIYSGCGNHNGDLEIVKPVLLALLDEFPNLEVIMAQEFPCFSDVTNPRFKVVKRWVDIINYPSMLKGWDGDIGIAPLRDNAFNRAKSNLRWLEYSALKIPTVASDVRPFSESVKTDQTGFLCKSRQEWYDTLKVLTVDAKVRSSIGKRAYDDVKERFNMDKVAAQYADLLKEIRG